MKCKEIRKIILDYHWGELAKDVAREVEEHLSSCSRCRRHEAKLREFMNLLSDIEHKEPSERPYVFLRSRVAELAPGEPRWRIGLIEAARRPIPAYRAALVALGLVLLSWLGGNFAGRRVEQAEAPSHHPGETVARGAPQHPDTDISFVVTPTVWTRVHYLDTIPGPGGPF